MFSVANNEALLVRGLKVLGDGLSRALLRALVNGPAACMDLAKRFQCSQSAAWKRLEELRKAGLIQRQARHGYKGQALYIACVEKVRALFAQAMSCVGIAESPG